MVRTGAWITVGLLLAHGAGLVMSHGFGHGRVLGLVPLFDLNREANLPTFFSALLLLACSGVLGVIAARVGPRAGRRHWAGLAGIFLFLSIDEMCSVHEPLQDVVHGLLNVSGLFNYAWVIPYGAALLVIVALYSRFVLRLPVRTRNRFLVAALVYVSGALGVEMLGGWYDELHGSRDLGYALLCTLEETLEMSGALLFLSALLTHLTETLGVCGIGIARDPSARTVEPPSEGLERAGQPADAGRRVPGRRVPGRRAHAPRRWLSRSTDA